MAYAFRIHEPHHAGAPAPMAASTMTGWTETSHIAGNLLANIELGQATNKMGTSIPSLFARLKLFEVAFQTLKGRNFQEITANTSDTALVSDCLDLLEFLFQHGQDPKLVVKHWNAQEQMEALRKDGYGEHSRLANVIQDELKQHPELGDIYLFFYKTATPTDLHEREFLIGGTSPYTLVFTSPNWRRTIKRLHLAFNRLDGSPLFEEDDLRPLSQRDPSFRDLLYSLRKVFQKELSANADSFNDYITTIANTVNPDSDLCSDQESFYAKYASIVDSTKAVVMAGQLPLCYLKNVPTASDYEIMAKSDRYKTYLAADGSTISVEEIPLALNENGLPGARYVGSAKWDKQKCKIIEAVVRTQQLHERILPGSMGVKRPFIVWSDLLEDKIIKVPYTINSERFVTAFVGESKYLLPLKRNFFKYFNTNDISKEAVKGTGKKLVEICAKDNSIVVTVNVPIQSKTHHTIALQHTYCDNDIVTGNFLLGFFPFYRCDDNRLNRYSVMNCGSGARLNFINIGGLDRNVTATSTVRTPQQKLVSQTEYYLLKSAFDLIEVSMEGAKGLIIPLMQQVGSASNRYKFAVDFGTSNTYIAHTTTSQPAPETLEVDEHDQQTVYLNKADDFGDLTMMRPFMAREFAPVKLGKRYDVSYPARTATCETSDFESSTPDLFGTISIGFNMMHEPQALNIFKYKTGLKWLLEEDPGNQHHTNRVKYYFLQTLWMLKNESLMNDGDDTFDVYITFPETMKQPTKSTLMGLWQWARKELNINCNFYHGTEYSESIAPYNSMATMIGGASFLNVDIGGGTSDLLFVNKNAAGQIESAHYSSSMFAGDDLWGDGIKITINGNQLNNGFVEYLFGQINDASATFPSEILSPLKSLMGGVTSSSADVMGYLFKYDTVFGTSAKIMGQRNLYSLVFIHYAALMYNVSRLIKKMKIEIPLKLSFTGMGSKYISLISTDMSVVKKFTILLLQKFTGQTVSPAFGIIENHNADVKEITAKGVLMGLDLKSDFKIPTHALLPVVDYGFDCEKELTYADVRKDEVRMSALNSFSVFVNSLRDKEVSNFLFNNFGLTISNELLDDLEVRAQQSFVTMSASISTQYDGLNVTETLFFWPLKNSLVELSKNYSVYN